jgi:putative RecB family exonuclease
MNSELITRDSLAEQRGGLWDYVSPSRLALWLKCPLAFKFRYVDGVETPMSPGMFVGRMVHSALESWYRHRQFGVRLEPDDVARRLVESWGSSPACERVAFESCAEEETSRKQSVDLVLAYLAQLPADEAPPLAIETAMKAPLIDPSTGEDLGVPLVGVIDLVLDEPDGGLIADFKTTARGGEPLETAHEIQLSSYSYLYRHTSLQPESALEIRNLVKTKTPKIETHRYVARTERHYRRLFAVVRSYLDDLDRGRFVFRPGLGCSMCDFRDSLCSSWGG